MLCISLVNLRKYVKISYNLLKRKLRFFGLRKAKNPLVIQFLEK